jgi:hypothetical protein
LINEWRGLTPFSPTTMVESRRREGEKARSKLSSPRLLDSSTLFTRPCEAKCVNEPRGIDAAVGDVAGAGVAGEIVELVHVERAGEEPAQQPVDRRQLLSGRIDDRRHPRRRHVPRPRVEVAHERHAEPVERGGPVR